MLDDFGLGLSTYSTWTGECEGLAIAEASLSRWHISDGVRCKSAAVSQPSRSISISSALKVLTVGGAVGGTQV